VLAAVAMVQSGCTTSLAEWVHNGFKVGPNYHNPPAPLPHQWIDQNDPHVRLGDPNLATWWDVFDDPILNGLLQRAYQRNLTLRASGFQVQAANEQRKIACAELLPQSQSFNASYTRLEASANGGNAAAAGAAAGTSLTPSTGLAVVPTGPTTPVAGSTAPATTTVGGSSTSTGTTPTGGSAPSTGVTQTTTTTPTNPSVGSSTGGGATAPGVSAGTSRFFTNIATSLNLSWELDFWGLFRRNLEAATASLDQSVDNFDEQLVLLLANVATQYVEIRTLQKRLELARLNVAQQEPLVATFYQRYKTGVANSFPGYFQLKSNLENTRALIPQLEISLRQANNQLCVLLGMPVRDLLPELGDGTVPDPEDPGKQVVRIPRPRDESVVVGIPGNLLLRRPDVKAARQQLIIQSAEIGIAEAELYPHVGINGSIGLAANSFAKLFNTRSWTGSIGPSLNWNILNYGRLLANVRFQSFQFQQFVATYQNTILSANQDAENALVGYLKTLDQAKDLQNSADAASKLTSYLIRQFKQGYLPPGQADTSAFINQIFTAVNFQVTQQDAAAQAEGNIALNLVLLYRALGGGWQIRLKDRPGHCPEAEDFLPHPGPDDFSLPVTAQQLAAPAQPAAPGPEMLPEPRPAGPAVPGRGVGLDDAARAEPRPKLGSPRSMAAAGP
jgi:NodT family efflux transporter outer membrane factor (OMF) lipoprotein